MNVSGLTYSTGSAKEGTTSNLNWLQISQERDVVTTNVVLASGKSLLDNERSVQYVNKKEL